MASPTPPADPPRIEPSPASLSSASATTTQAKAVTKPRKEKPAPRAHRIIRSDDTHRCPLHETADECKNVRIDPQLENITSRLVGDIRITFDEAPERMRGLTHGTSNMLPPTFYRTFYEGSATLSSRVSKDTHVRHRQNEKLKLRPGNAFQTIGEVVFKNSLTKEAIERQLVWNKKADPSTWISMFNKLSHAKRRTHFHYDDSKRIGQRVTIAAISTADMVAATIHADCRSIWEILVKDKYLGWDVVYSVTMREVQIPIWVHKSVIPADGSSITPKQLMASCPDLFVSIQELRRSNLVEGPRTHSRRRTITADGHNYEWLALGRILESRIKKVIPFDGKIFHMTKPTTVVRSEAATEDWIFDFDVERWRLESEMKTASTLKRKMTDSDEEANNDKKKKQANTHQIQKGNGQACDLSIITTIFDSCPRF